MKKWNVPVLEELNITETANRSHHGGRPGNSGHGNGRPDCDDRFPSMNPPSNGRPGCGEIGGSGNTDNDDTESLS